MEYLAYWLAGSFAGLCAGLFGVGGGLIIVPVLILIFSLNGMHAEVVAHVALGTSLATIIITSISSLSAHHKHGNVRWEIMQRMAVGLIVGSLVGAFVATLFKSDTLQFIIGVGAIIMALKMLFLPNKSSQKPPYSTTTHLGAGFGIGMLSAIFGIGGGSLMVPYLSSRITMKQAVGTSAACGLPIAIAGAIGFGLFGQGVPTGVTGTVGFVHVVAFVCVSIASFIFAKIGAKFANQLPAATLKKAFGVLLLVVGLNLCWQGLGVI